MAKVPTVYVVKSPAVSQGRTYHYAYLRYDEWDPEKNRPQPKSLAALGRTDLLDPGRLNTLGGVLREWLRKDSSLPFDALKEHLKAAEPVFRVLLSRDFGLRWLIDQAWDELGYKEVLAEIAEATKHEFRIDIAIFGMVLVTIIDPQSKLAAASWKDRSLFFPEGEDLDEADFYKAMDVLAANYKKVEARLTEQLRTLGVETHGLAQDTTSIAMAIRYDDVERKTIETARAAAGKVQRRAVVNDPPLRMRGKSKDHRPDLPQVVVDAVVGDHGLVVQHATHPGNTSDQTITDATVKGLEALGYAHKDLKWAGDTGTNSAENRDRLRAGRFDFVLGEGVARTKVVEKVLSTPGRYHPHPERPELLYKCVIAEATEEADPETGKTAPERLYVIRWNKDEEACALHRIDRHLKEIDEVLARDDPKAAAKLPRNPKLRRYVKHDGRTKNGKVILDREAIRDAKRLAGKSVIGTDKLDSDPIDADDIYRSLFDVERLWSQLKTNLGMARTRHRRTDRIEAHHMIQIMAVNLVRWLERKCGMTIARLRRVFENFRVQKIEMKGGGTFWECVDLEPEQREILKTLGYDLPPKRFTTTIA